MNKVKVSFGYSKSSNVNIIHNVKDLKFVLSKMVDNNFGRIINVTSGAPLDPNNNSVVYASSKASLNAITVATANECKNYNIKINLMSPGPVKSEMAPNGPLEPTICHPTMDYLLSIDNNGPSGKFFWLGYELPLYPDLKDEFSELPHERGTLSMARSSSPDSANSQFFICFETASHLDRQYTVFGKVIKGMELIDLIKKGDGSSGQVSSPDKIISLFIKK